MTQRLQVRRKERLLARKQGYSWRAEVGGWVMLSWCQMTCFFSFPIPALPKDDSKKHGWSKPSFSEIVSKKQWRGKFFFWCFKVRDLQWADCRIGRKRNGYFRKWWYPQIIHFNRGFHYKPSIWGVPYFWKHPNEVTSTDPNLTWRWQVAEAQKHRPGELKRCFFSMCFCIIKATSSCTSS